MSEVDEIDSTKEYLARITELERDVARFSIRCNRLEDEKRDLQTAIRDYIAELTNIRNGASATQVQPFEDGTYPYSAFVTLIHARLVDTNSWQTDFCLQTGIDKSRFTRWRHSQRVPADVFAAADKLHPATKRDRAGWSKEELEELQMRIANGEKHKDIATALNERWGRDFTTNSITGMADRMKKKAKNNA